jgi:hypothetical protein
MPIHPITRRDHPHWIPHRHADGDYQVCRERDAAGSAVRPNTVSVWTLNDVARYVGMGYSLRMSEHGKGEANLIVAENIVIDPDSEAAAYRAIGHAQAISRDIKRGDLV